MSRYHKLKIKPHYLALHALSLLLSLYIGYVFISYTDAVNEQPICGAINPDKRRLINIYGYIKFVLAAISAILFLMFLYK